MSYTFLRISRNLNRKGALSERIYKEKGEDMANVRGQKINALLLDSPNCYMMSLKIVRTLTHSKFIMKYEFILFVNPFSSHVSLTP